MKKITVKIPSKLEKSFDNMVKIEFAGNVSRAVVTVLSERLEFGSNGVSDRLDDLEKAFKRIEKLEKVLRTQGLDV